MDVVVEDPRWRVISTNRLVGKSVVTSVVNGQTLEKTVARCG